MYVPASQVALNHSSLSHPFIIPVYLNPFPSFLAINMVTGLQTYPSRSEIHLTVRVFEKPRVHLVDREVVISPAFHLELNDGWFLGT